MGFPTNFQIFSLFVSTVLMVLWIQRYKSTDKTWFFRTSGSAVMVGVARFWYYVFPFMALGWIIMGIGDFWELGGPLDPAYAISVYWMFAGLVVIVFGIVFGFRQPNWLSPPWLRRLKREHGDIINELLIDAVGLDKQELGRRLETWENIEEWIARVEYQNKILSFTESNQRKPSFPKPTDEKVYKKSFNGVNFQEANLRGADMYQADLRNADLHKADLREADLREADLRGADLREADLRGAKLQLVDLRGANLWGTKIDYEVLAHTSEMDLREADLRFE